MDKYSDLFRFFQKFFFLVIFVSARHVRPWRRQIIEKGIIRYFHTDYLIALDTEVPTTLSLHIYGSTNYLLFETLLLNIISLTNTLLCCVAHVYTTFIAVY